MERAQQTTIFCTQGIVVWVPIWRGLAFQTLPFVSADKLTKPETTSFSPTQNMPRDISYRGHRVLIWQPSCGARQKTSTGQLVLWHQLDWRSDLHGCRSLKKKKKNWRPETRDVPVDTRTGWCHHATRGVYRLFRKYSILAWQERMTWAVWEERWCFREIINLVLWQRYHNCGAHLTHSKDTSLPVVWFCMTFCLKCINLSVCVCVYLCVCQCVCVYVCVCVRARACVCERERQMERIKERTVSVPFLLPGVLLTVYTPAWWRNLTMCMAIITNFVSGYPQFFNQRKIVSPRSICFSQHRVFVLLF